MVLLVGLLLVLLLLAPLGLYHPLWHLHLCYWFITCQVDYPGGILIFLIFVLLLLFVTGAPVFLWLLASIYSLLVVLQLIIDVVMCKLSLVWLWTWLKLFIMVPVVRQISFIFVCPPLGGRSLNWIWKKLLLLVICLWYCLVVHNIVW